MLLPKNVGILLLALAPGVAGAGILTLKGTIPVGSAISATTTFMATTHVAPLCGLPDFTGFHPNDESEQVVGQVNADGTYELTVKLKPSHHLSNDPLNICRPKIGPVQFMNISINVPGKLEADFEVAIQGYARTDLSAVRDLTIGQYGLVFLDGQEVSSEGFYIPDFSPDKNYVYTISIQP